MLGLLHGIEGTYTCTCGRGLKVGVSSELWHVKLKIEQELETGNVESTTAEERSRFTLLEVE